MAGVNEWKCIKTIQLYFDVHGCISFVVFIGNYLSDDIGWIIYTKECSKHTDWALYAASPGAVARNGIIALTPGGSSIEITCLARMIKKTQKHTLTKDFYKYLE